MAPVERPLDPPQAAGDRPVIVFFVLACAFSWSYWIPLALVGPSVERGDMWPTQLPGLLGPMLAAFVVVACTEGPGGMRQLLASMVRLPRGARPLLATVAPLAFLAFALLIATVLGQAPPASDFLRYSGTSASVAVLMAVLVVTGFGEETGWRGYALARLQRRHGPLRATLAVTAGWATWHIPLFFVLASYSDFGPLMAVGWLIGLAAGGFVLTMVYNVTGASVLAAVIWHTTYNVGAGTNGGDGLVAPLMTACVIFWAVSLVQRHRSGLAAFGHPPPPPSPRAIAAERHGGRPTSDGRLRVG
jgi:membrane protease YdiL (CAAX protease family)